MLNKDQILADIASVTPDVIKELENHGYLYAVCLAKEQFDTAGHKFLQKRPAESRKFLIRGIAIAFMAIVLFDKGKGET